MTNRTTRPALLDQRMKSLRLSPATDKLALTSTGAINVLKNATSGTFTLTYQICDLEDLNNCASAKATIDLSGGGGGGGGGKGR